MNLPSSFLRSLEGLPGYDAAAFEAAHHQEKQLVSLRINSNKISEQEVTEDWDASITLTKVDWCSTGYYLSERPSFTLDPKFHAGAYYVQEASSMFLAQAMLQTVDLTQPLVVLDLCAAPGGKSTLLQSLISNESLLISNEVIQSRVSVLRENIMKWGADNVIVTNNDPRDFKQLGAVADVLVVDAPCSGSGLFRRDPEAIQEWSAGNVTHCSLRQQRILADAWHTLKEGGILIYSTCSYAAEENEQVLSWLINELHAAPKRLSLQANWGMLEVETPNGGYGYRCWPHKVQGEGFFLAVVQKTHAAADHAHRVNKKAIPSRKEIDIAARWLKDAQQYDYILQGDQLAVVRKYHTEIIQQLMSFLRVRYAGVELGMIAKNDLLPSHAFALSHCLSESIPSVSLSLPQALQYLRKQEMGLDVQHKGWTSAMYRTHKLGWMKCLGNRINNYYPKEYRILK